MVTPTTRFDQRIESGKPILIAEISPPRGTDPAPLREIAHSLGGKTHALGVSDNRDRVSMSALAAASLLAGEGIEPILHVTTRDRNRIALVSEALGAQALGIRNLLCTSGTHQTLGRFRAAKNVYDVDPIQLLQTYAGLANGCSLLGEQGIDGAGPFCLGAVAAPYADPLELQVSRLVKKARAGARFLVTQPVYDLERFGVWWQEVTRRGVHEMVAILAGIQPLSAGQLADAQSGKRPSRRIPEAVLAKLASASDPVGKGDSPHLCEAPSGPFRQMGTVPFSPSQRRAAVEIAVETIGRLSEMPGLRGFSISVNGDADAALAILDQSGLS